MNIIFVLTCSGGATGFHSPAQRPFRRLLRYTRASGHSCARSRPSRCRPSSAVTLRSSRRYYQFFALRRCPQLFCFGTFFIPYKNDTVSSRVPGLKAEDLRRPSRSPLAKRVQLTSSRVINEMVLDGGGHFNPAGIDGVHTLTYYSRPIQHIAVPRVIQYNTYYTDIQTNTTYRLTNVGIVT